MLVFQLDKLVVQYKARQVKQYQQTKQSNTNTLKNRIYIILIMKMK